MKDFKGKTLVITGGAFGFGKAMALEGAKRGMNIVINDIQEEPLKKTYNELTSLGANVKMQVADISLIENVRELFKIAIDNFKTIDLLFNSAGVAVTTEIWETPIDDIKWITEVNFLSHAYVLREFLPQMIAQKTESAIVNVASIGGLIMPGGSPLYLSTKGADVALAESTYLRLKHYNHNNIQMHVFCPAFVQTNLHHYEDARPERYNDKSDDYYKSESYLASLRKTERSITTGMPIDSIAMSIFTAIEEDVFYILTNPEYLKFTKDRYENLLNFRNPSTNW